MPINPVAAITLVASRGLKPAARDAVTVRCSGVVGP